MFKRRHHFVVFEERFDAVMKILDQIIGCDRWAWGIIVEKPIGDQYRYRISMRTTRREWSEIKRALRGNIACSDFR